MTNLLNRLPEIKGKTGWPWTEEFAAANYHGKEWPKISIVTPSFNQGNYIEETIRSILLQNYPNIEYYIIDGGSTDNTVEIIKKYESFITGWISEVDKGQADAINKGLALCSGDIFNWINSDDYLTIDALHSVGAAANNDWDLFAGRVNNFSDDLKALDDFKGYTGIINNSDLTIHQYFDGLFHFHQPGIWLNLKKLGKLSLDTQLHYCFDLQLFLKILEQHKNVAYSDKTLVNFRLHDASKTSTVKEKFLAEIDLLISAYTRHPDAEIATKAIRSVNRKAWAKELENIRLSEKPRFIKLLSVCIKIMAKPIARFNRFSLGALKKILQS